MKNPTQQYFPLPYFLPEGSSKVFTKDNNQPIDFHNITGKQAEMFIKCINGKEELHPKIQSKKIEFNKDDHSVYIDDVLILTIRGWGYLIGNSESDLGLPMYKAKKIQQDLGEWIVTRFKGIK